MATLPNPFEIQSPSRIGRRPDVPLILIHDGGGTIVSYTMMGPLNRPVYGIHNPKFYSGGHFEGGFKEMTNIYTEMIRKIVLSGDLLIGGWSLGGILSIQIAHNLARSSPHLHVLGIIQIDSPCLQPPKDSTGWAPDFKVVAGVPAFHSSTNSDNRARVNACMKASGEMFKTWSLPIWRHASGADGAPDSRTDLQPPPVVLIKCREYAPVPEGSEPGAVVRVDRARERRDLGWGEYWAENGFEGKGAGTRVLETEGHHYNVFAVQNLDCITEQVAKAVNIILDGKVGKGEDRVGGVSGSGSGGGEVIRA